MSKQQEAIDQLEKITPQNLDAEKSALGACMRDNEAARYAAENLEVDDYYRSIHSTIFEKIIILVNNGEPVDLVTVSSELRKSKSLEKVGGAAYLSTLIEACPSSENIQKYVKEIQEKSIQRQYLKSTERINKAIYNNEFENLNELRAIAEKNVFEVGNNRIKSNSFISVKEAMEEDFVSIEEQYNKPYEEKLKGPPGQIKTGFSNLDKSFTMNRKELTILAARANMGKSAAGLQIAAHVSVTEPGQVLFYSGEMYQKLINKRLLSLYSGVSINQIDNGLMSQKEFDELLKARDYIKTLPVHYNCTRGIDILEIRNNARSMAKELGNISLILVDHLLLVKNRLAEKGGLQKSLELGKTTKELREMADEVDAHVICLTQLNRNLLHREDKRPNLSDLKESGSIEEDADNVVFLHREGYYKSKEIAKKADGELINQNDTLDIAEYIIGKQRDGKTGIVKMYWDGDCTRFLNIDN